MEINSLLLQVARAINSVSSNQLPETKARLLFMGNSALQVLKEKYTAKPEIIADLLNEEEYSTSEWREVQRFLGRDNYFINSTTFRQWDDTLNTELHLSLTTLYWNSYRKIEEALQKDNSENLKNADEIQSNYDKYIKLLRSAQYLIQLNGYDNNSIVKKINKEYPHLIENISLFTLKNLNMIKAYESNTLKKIQNGISQNCLRILNQLAKNPEPSDDDKDIFEMVVEQQTILANLANTEQAKKASQLSYEGLLAYYKANDDMDNLFKIQSKKEILDMKV